MQAVRRSWSPTSAARASRSGPTGLPKDVPVEKTLEQIGKALIECGKAAADAGVEIWVEVHGGGTQHAGEHEDDHGALRPSGRRRHLELQPRPTSKNGSVAESFELLRPWIRSCHINELYKDAAGEYPYRELFRLLRGTATTATRSAKWAARRNRSTTESKS